MHFDFVNRIQLYCTLFIKQDQIFLQSNLYALFTLNISTDKSAQTSVNPNLLLKEWSVQGCTVYNARNTNEREVKVTGS